MDDVGAPKLSAWAEQAFSHSNASKMRIEVAKRRKAAADQEVEFGDFEGASCSAQEGPADGDEEEVGTGDGGEQEPVGAAAAETDVAM